MTGECFLEYLERLCLACEVFTSQQSVATSGKSVATIGQPLFINPESVIHLLKDVYVNFVIAMLIINHTSYIAGGRLNMSPLN